MTHTFSRESRDPWGVGSIPPNGEFPLPQVQTATPSAPGSMSRTSPSSSTRRPPSSTFLLVGLALVVGAPALGAQEGYRTPSDEIVEILEAPTLPEFAASPDGRWAALLERPSMVALRDIAEPRLHLAGYRLNPRTNGPSVSNRAPVQGIEFLDMGNETRIPVLLPEGAGVEYAGWSPTGDGLLFTRPSDGGYELWWTTPSDPRARRVGTVLLNAAHGAPCRWLSGDEVVCRTIPTDRGEAPARPPVPEEPRIQDARAGEPAPARTFQDLLLDGHDANLFEYYFTSQLARVELSTGLVTPVGDPAILDQLAPSPDGRFLYVVRTVRPFSFVVPDRWRTNDWFPREMEIWTRDGERVRTLASLPLEEEVAVDDFRSGPRGLMWQPGSEAAMVWAEDVEGQVPGVRDRILRLEDPSAEPQVILELEDRFDRMAWTRDGRGLVSEIDRFPRRAASWTRSWLVTENGATWDAHLVEDRSAEERFGAPGTPMTRGNTLLGSGDWIYLQGDGVTPDGERPFLDRMNLATLETERIWESDPDRYEVPVGLLAGSSDRMVIRSESPADPPNYHLADRTQGATTALTDIPDPAPQLQGVERRVLTYEREDGIRLAGVVYTPPGWDGETRLPTVLWAYPREFVSPDAAAQV
ncbi:MAG: hypothetical protein EA422_00525, partial [Gemmatimonadales bacterium]